MESQPLTKSALLDLVNEFYIAEQTDGEYSIRELSAKLNRKEAATKKIMESRVSLGTWAKRTAKLANGHLGVVYFEAKK